MVGLPPRSSLEGLSPHGASDAVGASSTGAGDLEFIRQHQKREQKVPIPEDLQREILSLLGPVDRDNLGRTQGLARGGEGHAPQTGKEGHG